MTDLLPAPAGATDILGWALIHFVWQGTALALALAGVRLLLPRGWARTRYVAGCLTMLAMLAAPALTVARLTGAGDAPVPATATPAAIPEAADTAATKARGGDLVEQASHASRPVVATGNALPWLVLAWASGVLFCAVRLAGGWWQARRLVRAATRPVAVEVERMAAALALSLDVGRPVRLLESARLAVPVVVGWLRPVLIVPAAVVAGLPPQQLEAVLAHELAHIRRHDYLVNLLQSAVEALLFYHPAVWWVSHTVRVEREHCCDDLAVGACGDAVLYARALTAIETMRHERTGMAMAMTGSPLLARVRRVLEARTPASPASSGWIVAALTALMVSGAGVTGWFRGTPVERAAAAAHEEDAGQSLARSIAEQERALADAARAVERASQESNRAARSMSRQEASEARHLAREAMRQAREMIRDAARTTRDAAQAMRKAARAAGHPSWTQHAGRDGSMAEPPEPPDPPLPPLSLDETDVPDVPLAPLAPLAPPAPPAPPDVSLSSKSERSSWNVTSTTNGVTLEIKARGSVEFTDDETDVKFLSSGGSFLIEQRHGKFLSSDVKRFEARERNGAIERRYVIDGQDATPEDGRRWLATFLPETLREMAIDAERRVARQLAAGGPARVLDEAAKVKSDFAKSRYLRQLYRQVELDAAMLARSLDFAGRAIASDFELAQALRAAADRQPMNDAIEAFVTAARAIGSDFEQRQALGRLLGRRDLSAPGASAVFRAALPDGGETGIESSFELSQLLRTAVRHGHVTPASAPDFVRAARAVESDFERGQVVAAISGVELPDGVRAEIVRLAATIGSDFERAQTLVRLARRGPHGPDTRKALAEAAMGIGSDFERGKALSALTRAGVLDAK